MFLIFYNLYLIEFEFIRRFDYNKLLIHFFFYIASIKKHKKNE
jgi:hypothetical protein